MREWMKVLTVVAVVFLAATLLAQDALGSKPVMQTKNERELERQARRLDGEANTPAGEQRVLEQMSGQLGVPVSTLRQQKLASGLSYGNLFIANALAQRTGKSFDEILAERRSGQGWGQIARENQVRLGDVVSRMKRSSRAVEAQERHETRVRGDGRGERATLNRGRDTERPPMSFERGRPAAVGHGGGRRR